MTKLSTTATQFFAIATFAILAAALAGLACVGESTEPGPCDSYFTPTVIRALSTIHEERRTPWRDWEVTAAKGVHGIEVEWDALDDPAVEGYRLLRWTVGTSEFRWDDFDGGLDRFSHLDTQLVDVDADYENRVFPLFPDRIGHPSFAVRVATPSAPPDPPFAVWATVDAGVVKVRWSPNPVDAHRGFRLIRREVNDAGRWKVLAGSWDYPHPWFDDSEVESGKTYEYRVCSKADYGVGKSSKGVVVDPQATPSNVRVGVAPSNIRATNTPNGIKVEWDDPKDDSILGYHVHLAEQDFDVISILSLGTISNSIELPRRIVLLPDSHWIEVRALTRFGPGPWSERIRLESLERRAEEEFYLSIEYDNIRTTDSVVTFTVMDRVFTDHRVPDMPVPEWSVKPDSMRTTFTRSGTRSVALADFPVVRDPTRVKRPKIVDSGLDASAWYLYTLQLEVEDGRIETFYLPVVTKSAPVPE